MDNRKIEVDEYLQKINSYEIDDSQIDLSDMPEVKAEDFDKGCFRNKEQLIH